MKLRRGSREAGPPGCTPGARPRFQHSARFRSRRETFRADLLASLVVFLVALPLCVGIAVACGMPAELGLITGVVGGRLLRLGRWFRAISSALVLGMLTGIGLVIVSQQQGLCFKRSGFLRRYR